MASKTTTSSWLKEALLLLARIPNLLSPYLLHMVIILMPVVNRVYVNPLTAELSRHLGQMEEHTDPSSAEYARLLEETQRDARSLLLVSIADALFTLTLAFIARCFAASSSPMSGDRYSLAELLRELTKWRNLKASLVATAVLQLASVALLGGDVATVVRDFDSGLLSVPGFPFLTASLPFLYMGVVALVSAADKRKELAVLVLATLLWLALLIPVCEVAALYLYTEKVMRLGMSLLSVYDILQVVQNLLYLLAANVYHGYYKARAMEDSKDTVVACDGGNYKTSNLLPLTQIS
uniref:Uncharacterized protein n=1 Tax=Avena sativa TaxID=4498 RepID=A0ACD5ZDS0_AVESA